MRVHDAAEDRQGLDQTLPVGRVGQHRSAGLDVGVQLFKQGLGACIDQGLKHLQAGPAQCDGFMRGACCQFAVQPARTWRAPRFARPGWASPGRRCQR